MPRITVSSGPHGAGNSASSYDVGTQWQPVRITGTGNDRTALLRYPTGHGHVSIRVTAADTDGATVEQTVVNAYRLS